MSTNTWSYFLIFLLAGFLNSWPSVRRHRIFFIFILNVGVYSLLAWNLVPALFAYCSLSYLFATFVRDRKYASTPVLACTVFVLGTLALFIAAKAFPQFKFQKDLALSMLIPLGFSYIALQNIAFVLDSRHIKDSEWPSLFEFLASSMFFANITSGPIADIFQIKRELYTNRVSEADVKNGILRIVNGLAKKSISDFIALIFLTSNEAGFLVDAKIYYIPILLLRFYMDFSGYTDIAIGGAKLIGVTLPENFNRPYSSVTIADYWNRWHMTLGGWFKKYFFYPLQILIFRKMKAKEAIQIATVNAVLFLTFVGIGLWHGISFSFFVWGVLNAIFVLLSNKIIRLKVWCGEVLGKFIFIGITLLLIFLGQLLLLSESTTAFWENVIKTFSVSGNDLNQIYVALAVSLILFFQHKIDGSILDGVFDRKRNYLLLFGFQMLIVILFHKSGGTFLYANF